jgi:hypothetical protein
MKNETRQAITAAVFEATLVVLGVVLAFAANEWREARAQREQGRQVLAAIVGELESNRAEVAASLEYHTGRLEMLRTEPGDGWEPAARDFPRGFIAAARVARTAWESASETGALVHLGFDVVHDLSDVYAQQQRYEVQAQAAGDIIYRELFHGGMEAILVNHSNLANLISTFVYREQQLLTVYDAALTSVDAGPKRN